MDVFHVDDLRGVGLDRGRELVDRDVRAGARVQDPPRRGIGEERVDDEPRAVRGVQQIARLRPVAVDPELLAAKRQPREDRHDAALADGTLERSVRVERPDDGRRQAEAWKYESVSASPLSFDAAYGDAGFVGCVSAIPSGVVARS